MTLSSRFICYWASRDIATLGSCIFAIGLLAWGYHLEESATLVSIIVMALILPPFLLSPLADRLVSGKQAYPIALVAQCSTTLLLLPLLRVKAASDLRLVLVIGLALGISAAFIKASRKTMLPALAGEKATVPDTGLITTRSATMIVGPAAGTVIYNSSYSGSTGFSACVVATIITLAISTALLIFARPTAPNPTSIEKGSFAKQLAEIQKGLIYIWRWPALRTAAAIRLLAALAIGGLVVVQVALMVWGAFTSADNLGYVLAAQGLGIAIATLGNSFLRNQLAIHSRIAIGFGLTAAGGFGFAITSSLNGSILSGVAIGLGLGLAGLALTSLIGLLTKDEMAKPVRMGLDLAGSAAVLLSVTSIGRITDTVGPRFSIVLIAILLAVLALCAFGAAPDLGLEEGDKESTRSAADSLYDIECGVPAGTLLG
ncbi:MAG: MFS transporter [Chloroflexota bacterium]|jgi:hypothetical protein